MKFLSLAVVACLTFTSFTDAAAPFYANNVRSQSITDSYIVVLKNHTAFDTFQPRFSSMVSRILNSSGRRKTKIVSHFSTFPGFEADLDPAALRSILNMPEVDYVEQDSLVHALGIQKSPPSWGLPRISQRKAVGTKKPYPSYQYPDTAGQHVTVYVIDTGIDVKHPDFQGRAVFGKSYVVNGTTDDNGHGTHVAGTIGGKKYGVAKKVNLVGVKVLDSEGLGKASNVVKALEWVLGKVKKGEKAIVNMSLGGLESKAMGDATKRLFNANIPVIVAAGNDYGADPCKTAPAGSPGVFTVGATDAKDQVADFSSLGNCVQIFAPGDNIMSTGFVINKNKSRTYNGKLDDGTSMAAPHVAGVAALYMSEDKKLKTAKQVYNKLKSTAIKGAVKGKLYKSSNLLVSYSTK
ncbi:Subtilisin-like protease 3 [Mortierella sp. NVP85]|nr:Subtilisin-like protease 3 [Mortierella sp. NVP85]